MCARCPGEIGNKNRKKRNAGGKKWEKMKWNVAIGRSWLLASNLEWHNNSKNDKYHLTQSLVLAWRCWQWSDAWPSAHDSIKDTLDFYSMFVGVPCLSFILNEFRENRQTENNNKFSTNLSSILKLTWDEGGGEWSVHFDSLNAFLEVSHFRGIRIRHLEIDQMWARFHCSPILGVSDKNSFVGISVHIRFNQPAIRRSTKSLSACRVGQTESSSDSVYKNQSIIILVDRVVRISPSSLLKNVPFNSHFRFIYEMQLHDTVTVL